MGSQIITNDSLQITREQGFPEELDLEKHLIEPIQTEIVAEKIFTFTGKQGIRVYQVPPVRNFLIENHGGKWVYWGLIHILELNHDYVNRTTSGKFKIIHIYSPEEMKMAHGMIDRNEETEYAGW